MSKAPRIVTLYFDQNDELVDEETVIRDAYNYPNKYHTVQVNFGNEELLGDFITKDIFCGKEKEDNAQIFIENYAKSKAKHQQDYFESDLSNSIDFDEEKTKGISNSKLEQSLVMDLNPHKFEKPKDHLFFDFFSVYAKNFIDGKKAPTTRGNGKAKISLQKINYDDEDDEE